MSHWSDLAPLMHRGILDRMGDLLTFATPAGFDVQVRTSWEVEDGEMDDGRWLRLFVREEDVDRRLTPGSTVTVGGEVFRLMDNPIRRDGGVEMRAERLERQR